MKLVKIDITGMSCAVCSLRVEKAAMEAGASKVDVSLTGNYARIAYDEGLTDTERIIDAIKKAGYGASPSGANADKNAPSKGKKWRIYTGVLLTCLIMYLSMGSMLRLPELPFARHGSLINALLQAALAYAASAVFFKYFKVGFKNLVKGAPTMDSLVALGSSAALIYSTVILVLALTGKNLIHTGLYFESAAMILTLVYIGKTLEDRAKRKTGSALASLLSFAPESACVIRDGEEKMIFASELVKGDIAVVRSGESVPADGKITEGEAVIDESCLTGESYGVEKRVGSRVYEATVCSDGYFKFRVEKTGEESAFGRIVTLVENAASSKAPVARLADKVASVFVPAVMSVSLITFVFWMAFTYFSRGAFDLTLALRCAISVLVISCPCALGLATPTAVTCAVGKGASMGIFVKDAASIEIAKSIDTVVVDKTGTLTEGELSLVNIRAFGMDEARALALAAAVERGSSHPVARAIARAYAEKNEKPLMEVTGFKEYPGRGASGSVEGADYVCANGRMMKEIGAELPENTENDGYMKAYLATQGRVVAELSFFDMPKSDSALAVSALKAQGKRVVMLTGDNSFSAQKCAKEVGIDGENVISGVLPEGKSEVIKELRSKGARVAMVGDGINDAPSLALADLGIAMGQGKDVAIDSADMVLRFSRMEDLPALFALFDKTYLIIRENLFWALIYNVICIPVAAGVLYPLGILLSPMIGAAAMSFSSIFVVSNALRLTRFKYENKLR